MVVYLLNVEDSFILLTHKDNILTPEYRKIISDIRDDIPEDFCFDNGRRRMNAEFGNYLKKKLNEKGFKFINVKYADLE